MSTKINGFQNRPSQIGSGKVGSGQRVDRTSTSGESASTSVPANSVNVSDQARQLAALEQAVQALPAVNEGRVTNIRQQIENGTYEVAPERIADKLLQFERSV